MRASNTPTVALRDTVGHENNEGFTTTSDVTVLVAYAQAPTAYLSGTFTVQWGAQDSGAGISGLYAVPYKVDDGAWTSWLTATTATEAVYSGELGHLYTFRVRATDNVSNTGTWAEASTIVAQVTCRGVACNAPTPLAAGELPCAMATRCPTCTATISAPPAC